MTITRKGFLKAHGLSTAPKRIENADLVTELKETFQLVAEQQIKDNEKWGDTWKKRGLVYNGRSQEERFFDEVLRYIDRYRNGGQPIPWEKIIIEAHICMTRERYLL